MSSYKHEWRIRKKKGECFQFLHIEETGGHDFLTEWVTITRWGKDHVLINVSGHCMIPIDSMKMFIEEFQKFIKEMEAEKE